MIIKYIFTIGFRCYAPETLKSHGLRPYSGPFDYLFIDIESACAIINNKFKKFMSDIVIFNKSNNKKYSNTKLSLLNNSKVCYMAHDYNNVDLRININYMNTCSSGNLYDWKHICIFHHHDIMSPDIKTKISRRIERFNHIYNSTPNETMLFHITRIEHIDNIDNYVQSIVNLKKRYNITSYMVLLVCCNNQPKTTIYKDNILFIIKNVPSYNTQYTTYQTDNNFSFNEEIDIMKSYFQFKLVKLSDL